MFQYQNGINSVVLDTHRIVHYKVDANTVQMLKASLGQSSNRQLCQILRLCFHYRTRGIIFI